MRSFAFLAGLLSLAAAAPLELATRAVRQPLKLNLVNNLGGENLNCYITGKDSENRLFFLGKNGNLVYPSSGASSQAVSSQNIAIPMPPKGQSIDMTVPVAFQSGRIYFAEGDLKFPMDGTSQIQPSQVSANDASRHVNWGFVEMSMTEEGDLWANISYVDFVGLVISMHLKETSGADQEVIGLPNGSVPEICAALEAQAAKDGQPWDELCVHDNAGKPIRVLAPNNIHGGVQKFGNYYNDYINKVWAKYAAQPLHIDTQSSAGKTTCRVQGQKLVCEGDAKGFSKPTLEDIWGCNSGPFAVAAGDSKMHEAIIPRLCAAFVRSTFTVNGGNHQPAVTDNEYYKENPTMHYSRIIHAKEVDGKGYAFAYDDVNPSNSKDAAGLITSSNVGKLTFYVGGKNAGNQ